MLQNLEAMSPEDIKTFENNKPLNQGGRADTAPCMQDADLACDFSRKPGWWQDAIAGGRLLPWLWDLDAKQVKEDSHPGRVWNWELLAR